MREALNRRSNVSRQRRRESAATRRTASTDWSMPSQTNPLTPWSIISGTDPRRNAMTGVPQAIASICTSPNGSGQSIGNNSAAAFARSPALRSSPISPRYVTCGSVRSGSICASK